MKCIVCSFKENVCHIREDRTYEMDQKSSAWDFLAAAAVIGVLGFTKYQARQAEAKKQLERKHRKKELIKKFLRQSIRRQ